MQLALVVQRAVLRQLVLVAQAAGRLVSLRRQLLNHCYWYLDDVYVGDVYLLFAVQNTPMVEDLLERPRPIVELILQQRKRPQV